MIYVFGDYELEPQRYELRCLSVVCNLEPQVLELLSYLVRHGDRVVTKQELFEHLWPTQFVNDATLHQRLNAARKAVGDNGRDQHTIKTIRGRGYRFIAAVKARAAERTSTPSVAYADNPFAARRPRFVVEREAELAELHHCFTLAQHGQRQVVLISGEAGIGKTALAEVFISRLQGGPAPWVGYGQCVPQYGAGEAYRPVLEALGRLCRQDGGAPFLSLLRQHAPSWIAQMPTLLPPAERARLEQATHRATQSRLLRELAEALDILTAERPLLLTLEDLHWCDESTLEWLGYVARRRDAARLFVLGTHRPVETLAPAHPLRAMAQELRLHGHGVDLQLGYLSEAGVAAYLAHRLATAAPPGLARALRQRTNGNPLFLQAVVDELCRQDRPEALDPLTMAIPASVRQFIAQQIDQLPASDQTCLEAASVAGATFGVEAAAAGLGQPVEVVEAQCDRLARSGQFLRANGVATWPDGSLTARYGFIHAMYRDVLIERLSPGRRLRLHRRIGVRKEAGYGSQAREIAAELAAHFQHGQDYERAITYLREAAQNALQRSAHQEAVLHLRTGLNLLPSLTDAPAQQQHELAMRTALGPALIATQGYTNPEVQRTYRRARELCAAMGETTAYFPVLWGLWVYDNNRGSLDTAQALANQLLRMAKQDDDLLLQAYHALGNTLFWRGDFHAAQDVMDRAIALYRAEHHREQAFRYGGHDPAVCCLGHGASALWARGYPDQALRQSQRAMELAQSLSHPSSLAHALGLATRVHLLRSEREQVLAHAERAIAIAEEQGFTQPLAGARLRRNWARIGQGARGEALDQMRQSVDAVRDIGAANVLPAYLAQLAEAYAQTSHVTEALAALDDALDVTHRCGVRDYEAELYRLKGETLLRQERQPEAVRYFRRALDTARRQQAKSWELRAATSLSRLWQRQGEHAAARDLLAPLYNWFTEGFETTDLQNAKALLDTLSSIGSGR